MATDAQTLKTLREKAERYNSTRNAWRRRNYKELRDGDCTAIEAIAGCTYGREKRADILRAKKAQKG